MPHSVPPPPLYPTRLVLHGRRRIDAVRYQRQSRALERKAARPSWKHPAISSQAGVPSHSPLSYIRPAIPVIRTAGG